MPVSSPPRPVRPRPSGTGRRPPPRRPGAARSRRPPRRRLPNPHRRLEAILIVALMVLSVIAGRLIQLQGLDRSTYSALAQDQRLQQVTLTAARGAITDRHGRPIAETIDARDVVADPTQVADPAATAAAVAPLLHLDVATVTQQLQGHTRYARLAAAVAPALANKVMALKLAGIATIDTSKRVYPDGRLASNVVGVLGADGKGLSGLEYGRQQTLAGHNGQRVFEVGVAGDPIPDGRDVLRAPVPGTGLRLTLDSDIQWEAQQAIAQQVSRTRADSGSVIVMDPRTGAILAMAATPGFDPNHLSQATNAELGDAPVSQVYEPGSVMKGLTMSAALQDGLVTPTSKFTIPNSYQDGGSTFHDAENHGTLHLTLTGILQRSSNIGAIQVAKMLGPQRLERYFTAFGLGEPTGVGLPGDARGLVPPVSQWSATTLPTVSFGQGIGVTALQIASVYSTIANGGVRVTPTVVGATIGPDGTVHPAPPSPRHRVISPATARQMREMLQSVTTSQEGTAPAAAIAGYSVAGKTGTANRPDGRGGYSGFTSSFVGMVPARHPRLVAEVVLDNPRVGHFGGLVAAPVFHDVMSFALQSLGIPPTGQRKPSIPTTW